MIATALNRPQGDYKVVSYKISQSELLQRIIIFYNVVQQPCYLVAVIMSFDTHVTTPLQQKMYNKL